MYSKYSTRFATFALSAQLLLACIEERDPCREHPATCIEHPALARDLGDVASFYKTFESDEAAASFYAQLDEQSIAAAVGREPVTPVALSDPRYELLRSVISELHTAYVSLFPVLSALPPANVVLLPVAEVNAAAVPGSALSDNKLPNLFFVNEGLLELLSTGSKENMPKVLAALIGHELAHLYMRHADREVLAQLTQAYIQAPAQDEALGFMVAFPAKYPELTEAIKSYQSLTLQVGPLVIPEFSGLLLGAGARSGLIELIGRHKDEDACAAATKATATWLEFATEVAQPSSVLGEIIPPTEAQREKGAALSQELLAAARTCLQNEPPRFKETVAAFLGAPLASVDPIAQALSEEGVDEIYLAPENNIDRLVAFHGFFVTSLEDQKKQLDPSMRMYLKEEEADDLAMMVETELPVSLQSSESGGGVEALFRALSDLPSTCEDALEADTVPEYSLWNDHHSTCYRVFHARRMRRLLEEQAAGTVIRR